MIQTNDEIDVGGEFSTFEGMPEGNFVRVYGGANFGDGVIQFTQPVYGVLENGTNATITIQRLGGEGTAAQPTVNITFSTSDGTAMAGSRLCGSDDQRDVPVRARLLRRSQFRSSTINSLAVTGS